MFKIEWMENRPSDPHLQAHAQRDALHEPDPLFLPKVSAPLLARII